MRRLAGPVERVFFLALLASSALALIGLAAFLWDVDPPGVEDLMRELFSDYWGSRWHGRLFRWALLAAAACYVGAYHYHATLGRLINWVKSGTG